MEHTEQEYIIPGDTVELVVGSLVTRTKVQEVAGEGHFFVIRPTHQMIPVFFNDGEEVLFYFFRPDGLYSFHGEYLGREVLEETIVLSHFRTVSPVEKNQKRYAYRLPVTLPGTVRAMAQEGGVGLGKEEHSILTVNLSVEGILFSGNFRMETETLVLFALSLSDTEMLVLEGKILRFEPRQSAEESHRMAARFLNLSKRDQARLSRFILNQQVIDRRLIPEK